MEEYEDLDLIQELENRGYTIGENIETSIEDFCTIDLEDELKSRDDADMKFVEDFSDNELLEEMESRDIVPTFDSKEEQLKYLFKVMNVPKYLGVETLMREIKYLL